MQNTTQHLSRDDRTNLSFARVFASLAFAFFLVAPGVWADEGEGGVGDEADFVVLFPGVAASSYQLSSASCTGKYAVHTNTEAKSSGWKIIFWYKSASSVTTTTKIDYSFECTATFKTIVTGWGGIDRLVGVRVPAGASAALPNLLPDAGLPLKPSSGPLSAEWQEELAGGCDYLVGDCRFGYTVPIEGGGAELGVSGYPPDVCGYPPQIVAFNRANTLGRNLGPLGALFHDDGVVDVEEKIDPETAKLCVTISWTQVDSLGLGLGEAVRI